MYPWLSTAACSALIATRRAVDEGTYRAEDGVRRMDGHDVPDRAGLPERICRLMQTRAVEQEDGTYRMTGTKIFISGGEHDLADNIIHMVIAKIPDENGQIHERSFDGEFLHGAEILVKEDGTVGARNGVSCGGIEKKMGIKGQRDLRAQFRRRRCLADRPEDATAQAGRETLRLGRHEGHVRDDERGARRRRRAGHRYRRSRLSERIAYAHERRVGHALTGPKEPDKPADLYRTSGCQAHAAAWPRIRRRRARRRDVDALNMSIAHSRRPERETAGLLADLLTPVMKAFFTDMGFEGANMAMQCYGGHGYIRDNGVEQFVRDGRINQIYEGANGVQAMDLVGRKLGRNGGAAAIALFGAINGSWPQTKTTPNLQRS